MSRSVGPARPKPLGPPSFQFFRVIFALVAREMSTRYPRGSGGYLWAIATPVLTIMVMSVAFSLLLRKPSLGHSFLLFFATGYLPFHMYTAMVNGVMSAVKYNRPLLQYPAVTPIDTILARAILIFLTEILITTIILTGIIYQAQTPVNLDPLPMAQALLSAAFLGFGAGCMNTVVMAFIPTWERLWPVLTAPLFILSGILFVYEQVPPPFRDWLWYNPLAHLVGRMRSGVFGAYPAYWTNMLYVIGFAAVPMLVGLYLVRRHKSVLINPKF